MIHGVRKLKLWMKLNTRNDEWHFTWTREMYKILTVYDKYSSLIKIESEKKQQQTNGMMSNNVIKISFHDK